MSKIFHLALASDWAAAQDAGDYRVSTLGVTLAEEGFIHASRGDQWQATRERFYADVTEPLVLLSIDTDRLTAPVVEEPAVPGGETFPHIYGALNLEAVVQVIPLEPLRDGPSGPPPGRDPSVPEVPSGSEAPKGVPTSENFSTLFLREMYVNVLLGSIVMVLVVAGALLGREVDDEWGALWGTAVGLAIGVVIARAVSRRRG